MSSTIAEATNNGLLGAGIAYNVRLMPVKVCVGYRELMIANGKPARRFLPEDSGTVRSTRLSRGVRYAADNGAKVINISLGGEDPSNEMQRHRLRGSTGRLRRDGDGQQLRSRQSDRVSGVLRRVDRRRDVGGGRHEVLEPRLPIRPAAPYCEIAAPGRR